MPSTVVAKMEYDANLQVLVVTYTSGKVYVYKGVPPEVYEEMKKSGSKGRFLNYLIKGKYEYEKVE